MKKNQMKPFVERIAKLKERLKDLKADSLLIEDPVNIRYLTGLEVSAGILVIGKGDHFFLDGRYFEKAKGSTPVPPSLLSPDTLEKAFEKHLFGKILGFDRENTSFARYEKLLKMAAGSKKKTSLLPLDNPVKSLLRSFKSKQESLLMTRSAKLAAEGFRHGMQLLHTGISEQEVARGIKAFWLSQGADRESFEPIVAFGENSACPHHRPTNRKLKKGDIVLLDLGVTLHGYASDLTRTLFFGKPDPRLVIIYEVVLRSQEEALKICKPGTSLFSLDEKARGIIEEAGFGPHFSHGLGHGIGLEVHESPSLPRKPVQAAPVKELTAGMAITIEPGIYLPGIGGVRIEDTVIISTSGYKNLTPLPKDLIILDTLK